VAATSPPVEFTPPAVDSVPAADAGRDDGGAAGWWDLGGRVRDAINGWLREVVTSALTPVMDLLARTILATPQAAGPGRVADLWGVSRGLANTVFVLFVLVGGDRQRQRLVPVVEICLQVVKSLLSAVGFAADAVLFGLQ
jgi:hypothetical protein